MPQPNHPSASDDTTEEWYHWKKECPVLDLPLVSDKTVAEEGTEKSELSTNHPTLQSPRITQYNNVITRITKAQNHAGQYSSWKPNEKTDLPH